MKQLILLVILVAALVAGCANNSIVGTRGVTEAKCKKELVECRAYVQQVNTADQARERGTIGAAVGGVFGGLIGNGNSGRRGVGADVISGGNSGAVRAGEWKERILYRCLKNRGPNLLG